MGARLRASIVGAVRLSVGVKIMEGECTSGYPSRVGNWKIDVDSTASSSEEVYS